MRSAPSVEDCIIQNVFFLGISDAVFLSHRLNPLNTTGVNSRCCLSCTCAHIRACAYERSHLLLFTVRRAPLCQSVQNTHGCQIGIRSLLVRFTAVVFPGLFHNSLWSSLTSCERPAQSGTHRSDSRSDQAFAKPFLSSSCPRRSACRR